MKRRISFSYRLLLVSVFLGSLKAFALPNIIYILADDLGYGDLGCYGQEQIKTPRLDQMASEGLRFTEHYAGNTVCAPSRCSLLTGLHQGHARVRGNLVTELEADDVTLAEVLKQAGYHTGMIGKWGLGESGTPGDPLRQGFDYYFGYLNQVHAHNHYPAWLIRNGEKVYLNNSCKFKKTEYCADIGSVATERNEYSQDLFTEDAIRFIDESGEQPFFLYFASIIPHANNEGHWAGHHGMEVPDEGIYADKPWPDAERCKAAMISYLDADVGKILDHLETVGIASNTLVIFSSDNGPHSEGQIDPEFFNSNGRFKGSKRDLYEGGVRIPMIAWWPGVIAPGRETEHVSAFWDVLPTLADLTSATFGGTTDGISFLPTLLGKPGQKNHKCLYWEFHEAKGRVAVRQGKWKAVRYHVNTDPNAPLELYDLSSDPEEQHNVASKHPEIMREMEQVLIESRFRSDIPQYNFKMFQ